MRRRRKTKPRRPRKPTGSAFEQAWFVDLLPLSENGEYRVRLRRPSTCVSVTDAARLVGCSRQKIHNLCDGGALEWRWLDYKGAGGKKLLLVDSIQRYIVHKSGSPVSQARLTLQ